MKATYRLAFLGLSMSLVLTGCGGGSSTGSRSYIAGNGSVTFIQAQERQAAPVVEGATLSGGTFHLAANRVAVINVWASWCAPCRAEAPALASLSKTFPDVSFVGILTRDSVATANAFVRRFAIPYPTLIDDSILLGFHNSLVANAIPSTVVIDKKGKVAARISGELTVASLTDLINRVSAE
jgi:thiol-disulfide isomerase/thioredoxin